ncbi:MAG: hypothetical protein HQK51_02910 [Oligoflexia bacterium]|nr:hypothetical protein [Oligoflexia bacterium]
MIYYFKKISNKLNFNLKHYLKQIPAVEDFYWPLGPSPSFNLWARFWLCNIKQNNYNNSHLLHNINTIIPKKSILINLTPQIYNQIAPLSKRSINNNNNQITIKYNLKYEIDFLSKVDLHQNPIESMQIRILGVIKDQIICSKIIYGNLTGVSSLSQISNIIKLNIKNAKTQGLIIDKIEINHIHPTLELFSMNDHKYQYIFSTLSKSDIEIAKSIKASVDKYSLVMKAIIPSGVNYSFSI